jgi:hypothetical protein
MLKSQQNQTLIRGRLVRHPRSISSETTVDAQVTLRGIEISQETAVHVRHGSIQSLIVRVPFGPNEAWQVFQGKEVVRREQISSEAGESGRYRLNFDTPVLGSTTLLFKFRLPISPSPAPGTETKSGVTWIAIEDGSTELVSVTLGTGTGLRATVDDPAWAKEQDDRTRMELADTSRRYRPLDHPGGLKPARMPISISELDQLALPPIVVPRALFLSVLSADHQLRTRVWYWVESHALELGFRLPAGSRWVRARIDGRPAEQLETGRSGIGYRMPLPPESQSKPVLIELEYQSSATGSLELDAPRLDGDAVVLQTFWQIQIPWSHAVVGVPASWTDENEWYWDYYVWKRRPWRSLTRLTSWVSGSVSLTPGMEDVSGEEQEDSHAYLFSRAAEPSSLRLVVWSRAWLVALCSGLVLLAGFLTIYARVRAQHVWTVSAVLGLAFVVFAHPSVLLLILQSAFFGVVLTLVGLVLQQLVERARMRWPRGAVPVPSSTPGQSGLGASPGGLAGVGSDDSTSVRVRVSSSTRDHAVAPLVLSPQEPVVAESSRASPAG